ncbi:hypothetical protein D3C76_1452330 [compost metagenome]
MAIPAAMAQNIKTMSSGSLMAVRKRTILSAPTMPRERTTLVLMVIITNDVIIVISTKVVLKL